MEPKVDFKLNTKQEKWRIALLTLILSIASRGALAAWQL